MSDLAPVTPLKGAVSLGAVRVEELPSTGMIVLRGDFGSESFRAAVTKASGTAFPEVRRIERSDESALAWLSPDELMLFCAYEKAADLVAQINAELGDEHHMALLLSDARSLFRLTGKGAREALAKGAPIDLAPASFKEGDLRRTRLGQLAVAIWCVDAENEVFELMCFRSVAGHVFEWLANASRKGSLPEYF